MGEALAGARVLVTGATGLVGSHVAEALLASGASVTCLVRPGHGLRWLRGLSVGLREGELEQPSTFRDALAEAEIVFHVAGLTKSLDAASFDRVNHQGTAALLESCLTSAPRLRRVVLVSSLAAAGPSPAGAAIDEDAPCRPVTPYGRSKLEGELAARRYAARLPITVVRPPVVYGPRDPDNLLIYRQARRGLVPLSAPTTQLSVIHVRDLAEGILRAAEVEAAVGRTYFLAHPEPLAYDEMARLMADAIGRPARVLNLPRSAVRLAAAGSEQIARLRGKPTVFDRNKVAEMFAGNWVCSTKRATSELGFLATIPHASGFAETVAWYRTVGWL